MSKLIKINNDYASWIKHLSLRFRQSQIKAAVKVNSEMLKFYFSLGADIVTKQAESKWGDGFFKNLSQDLQDALPGVKGFSETSLKYAKYFYLTYQEYVTNRPQVGDDLDSLQKMEFSPQVEDEITPQIAAQIFSIPWGHHKLIIDKYKEQPQKALFYVHQTIKYNWSRAVLLNSIDTDLYERQGKAITNFKTTLPAVDSDLAQQLTKDPYCFEGDARRLQEHPAEY